MDFVFCTDKNYLKGYGVLMLSILRFAPPDTEQLRFHVLSDDLDEADKATLQGIAARREGTEVAFYEPARALSKEAIEAADAGARAIQGYITKTAYYYFLAADLLPRDVHRALYLDGDIVCAGSLEPLFALDLEGCPVGMGIDIFTTLLSNYNRLNYPPEEGYFNSGVILLDLDAWRKEDLSKATIGWLEANTNKRRYHDQDVINAVLHGRIFKLDFCYDVMQLFFHVFYWVHEEKNRYYAADTQFILKKDWPALLAACERPRLVHFDAPPKPWHKECDKPFTLLWRYFYAQSPWANEPLQWQNPPTAKKRIKRLGRKLFEALHLVEKRKPAGIPYPEEAYKIAQGVLDKLIEEDGARL